jgi:hypothetical protein
MKRNPTQFAGLKSMADLSDNGGSTANFNKFNGGASNAK